MTTKKHVPESFVSDVMEWLVEGDIPVLDRLREEFEACEEMKIEETAVGFYVRFLLRGNPIALASDSDFTLGDVVAVDPSRKLAMGFILFVKQGCIELLEGYTFGGSLSEISFDECKLTYDTDDGTRDFDSVKERLAQ
ncbi:hypothetical protein KOR42_44280 [Thalassoglobus neptunius]|uniref:Uncharacterized protein n=1 Tax=Thalassoglobus neptunius TaxID=1938619 RepID=A0A5C5VY84_9PLAN|nr:hypothetical protein [Thalassoglobus neptunius]TWT43548.1 hypothetical protein KOR42_44280 [Thalassoglobus neptunius]